MVAPRQIEPGGGNQRLEVVVAPEQQGLGLGEPALEDPQLGQGDHRVPPGTGHDLLDGGERLVQDVLGLAPSPEMAQQGALHAAAVAAQVRLRPGCGAEDAPLPQQWAPRLHPLEVGGDVARGVERAHRLRHDAGVLRATPAGQGHRLVEHGHALGHPARFHPGQPTVGQGLDLEVDVAEAPRPVEGQVGSFDEHGRVADVATQTRQRHPPLLDAGWLVLDQADGPAVPGLGSHPVAHEVGEQVADACGRQGGLAVVPGGRETPGRGGEVRDGALEVTGFPGLARRLQQVPRPNALLRQHAAMVQP